MHSLSASNLLKGWSTICQDVFPQRLWEHFWEPLSGRGSGPTYQHFQSSTVGPGASHRFLDLAALEVLVPKEAILAKGPRRVPLNYELWPSSGTVGLPVCRHELILKRVSLASGRSRATPKQ